MARSTMLIHTAPSLISPVTRGVPIGEVFYTPHTPLPEKDYSVWVQLEPPDQWLAMKREGHLHADRIG